MQRVSPSQGGIVDHSLDLKDLLSRIRQGDHAAYETIFNRYHAAAMSWAQSIVRDPYLADDIVQEAFIRMKDKLHQLKDDHKFAAWFRLMIRRMAINSIRGGDSRRTIVIEEMPEAGPASGKSRKPAPSWFAARLPSCPSRRGTFWTPPPVKKLRRNNWRTATI
jgi:DNA-directed RNA polymerase specialized sigma24 family protein